MTVLVGRWQMEPDPGEDLSFDWDSAGGINAWAAAHPGAGVYEADRTYPGPRILKFDEHLDRLEVTACLGDVAVQECRAVRRVQLEVVLGAADEQRQGDGDGEEGHH